MCGRRLDIDAPEQRAVHFGQQEDSAVKQIKDAVQINAIPDYKETFRYAKSRVDYRGDRRRITDGANSYSCRLAQG